jgi:hypothetical protein
MAVGWQRLETLAYRYEAQYVAQRSGWRVPLTSMYPGRMLYLDI